MRPGSFAPSPTGTHPGASSDSAAADTTGSNIARAWTRVVQAFVEAA